MLSNNLCPDSPDPYDTDRINDPQYVKKQHHCASRHESSSTGLVSEAIDGGEKKSREIGSKSERMTRLTTETVQSAALSFEGINNIERCDGLALGVFCVGDGITNDTLEEGLQDTTCLFVDHWNDALALGTNIVMNRAGNVLAEIRLTPPRRARRRMAGLVMPWMLSRRIFR